ncbi:glycosyltransferase family 2 protein [Pedobacter sp. PWIIR3]
MPQILISIFLYVVSIFLILRFSVTLFNFLSNPKLGHYGRKFTDLISVVVVGQPSKAGDVIKSLQNQDYRHIEILINNENSPLSELMAKVQGKYLLVLDQDTIVKNGLLNSMIYRMKVFDLAMLSLIPSKKSGDFKSNIFSPITELVLLNLLPLRLVRLLRSTAFSATDPRCMFFESRIYRENNWLDEEDQSVPAASRVSALIKERKLNSEILIANKMLYYNKDLNAAQYGDDLFQILGNNSLGALAYLGMVFFGPIVMFWNLPITILALPLGLVFLGRIMISFLTDQNPIINIILHPLQMVAMTYFLVVAVAKKIFTAEKI